jgi:hypothetical protein
MFVRKWLDQFYSNAKEESAVPIIPVHFPIHFPGTRLIINSIITKQHHEALAIYIIAVSLVTTDRPRYVTSASG